MPPVTSHSPPGTARVGDTIAWTFADANFPVSEGWIPSLSLRATASAGQVDSVAGWFANDGTSWTVTIPAASTAALDAGAYRLGLLWTGAGTYTGQRFSDPATRILVLTPDLAKAPATDIQSHAERMLAAIEAALEGRVTADVESYQVHGRAMNKIPMLELKRLHARYRNMVWRERHPGQSAPATYVQFGQSSVPLLSGLIPGRP